MYNGFLEIIKMLFDNVITIIIIFTPIIVFIGAIIDFINSRNNIQRVYIYLSELLFYKDKWIRYYDGLDVPDHIPHKSYFDLNEEEKKYFDNCKKQENMGKVYFDKISKDPILVLNMGTKMPTKLIEHNCNVITLENRGNDDITNLAVNYIELKMLNGDKHYLYGGDNKCYTNIIAKGEKINIAIDEVVDELSFSSCKISKEKYEELVDTDVLKDSRAEPLFCFAIIKVDLTLGNTYGKKINYELVIETKNNHLISKMKYINFLKRILRKHLFRKIIHL